MAQTTWQIRRISTAEMNVFRQIRLEALRCEPEVFASVYTDWLKFSDAEWNARMNIPIFVAFVEDKPVGLMALKRLTPPKMMHRATLMMVYINRRFRGSGLAAMLLDAVVSFAENNGITQIELGVRADNASAIRFYLSSGFIRVGDVLHGYADARGIFDEMLMIRQLN